MLKKIMKYIVALGFAALGVILIVNNYTRPTPGAFWEVLLYALVLVYAVVLVLPIFKGVEVFLMIMSLIVTTVGGILTYLLAVLLSAFTDNDIFYAVMIPPFVVVFIANVLYFILKDKPKSEEAI